MERYGAFVKKLNDAEIAAKSVEISKSLTGMTGGFVGYDLGVTQTIGDSARLAVSIRNRSDKMTREMLAGISSALKIDIRLAESKVVPIYEMHGWITVRREGGRILSLTENIPQTEDILSTL